MNWRQRLRLILVHCALLSVLVTFLTFAWMTRQPEAPFFDRLVQWPVVGGVAERVRAHYLPSGLPTGTGDSAATAGEDPRAESPTRYVGIGAALRAEPSAGAEVVHQTTRLDVLEVVGQQGRWLELRWGRTQDRETVWFDPEAPRDLTPPLGSEPLPPGPLAARAAEPERLEAAKGELGDDLRQLRRYGYDVLTDIAQERTGDLYRWLAPLAEAERAYERAYGVRPIGEPRETLVLFRREESYRRFQQQIEGLAGTASTGHVADGLMALFVGRRAPGEVGKTLLHEVGHLLNRRSVGPALPLWLEEGLAEDFAHFAGPGARGLDGYRSSDLDTVRIWGPLAGLHRLAELGFARVDLERLANYDRDLFVRSDDAIELYTSSGFLVRMLRTSEHPALGRGLRLHRFLESVAAGGSPDLERLVQLEVPGLEAMTLKELEGVLRADLRRLYEETPGLTFD